MPKMVVAGRLGPNGSVITKPMRKRTKKSEHQQWLDARRVPILVVVDERAEELNGGQRSPRTVR